MGWFSYRCSSCVVSMQIIQRLLLVLLFSIPAFLPNTSFATDYDLWWTDNTVNDKSGTAETACQKEVVKQNLGYAPASPIGYSRVYQQSGWRCEMTLSYPAGSGTTWVPIYFSTITCTGTQVYNYTTHTCSNPPPPACVAGCNGACGSAYKVFTATYPASGCINSCNYKFGDGIQSSGDNNWIVVVGNNLGTSCTNPTTPSSSGNTPEYDCVKQGKSYGTVNGVVVCTAMGSSGSQPAVKHNSSTGTSSNTTTDSSGNPTTTTQDTQKDTVTHYNSDGTVQTSSTQTTTNGDGTTQQSTAEKTETKDDYCASNPTSKACAAQTQCQENPEGPTCKHFCDKFPTSVACKNAEDFIGKPSDIPTVGNLTTSNIDLPSSLPSISINSNSSCPAPVTFAKYGATATVSFDWLCSYASYFKPLLIAFSLLAAAYIINGSRRED